MKVYARGAMARDVARGKSRIDGRARQGWPTKRVGAVLAALVTLLAPAWAQAALPVCSSSISACCKITSAGSYTVPADFKATGSSGACIRINAPNVTLSSTLNNDFTITSPGPGSAMKGLVIAPGADNAIVTELTMSGFDTGVEVNGNKAELLYVSGVAGGTGIVINGKRALCEYTAGNNNAHNGMVVNGRGFLGAFFGGGSNGANGLVVNPSAVGTAAYFAVGLGNIKAGVKIKDVTGGWFQRVTGESNGTYGIWLRGSTAVSLSDFTVDSNAIAGVYLGCHGDGPSTAACAPGIPPTNANMLTSTGSSTNATANGGSSPVQQYGVVIDSGNHLNKVLQVTGSGNSAKDGYDGNPNCDNNFWVLNSFTNPNRSCVDFALY